MRKKLHRTQPWINGKRQSFSFETKEELKEFKAKLALGLVGPQSLTSENPTFRICAERWLREYSKVEKGFNSFDEDRLIVGRYLATASFAERRLKDLTKGDLMTFKAELLRTPARGKTKNLNPKTVNHVLTVSRAVMNFGVDLGFIKDNPWLKVKPAKTKDAGFEYWTPGEREEFYRLAKPISPDVADVAYFACHTGLRRGELAALTWNAVDMERRRIRIQQSYSVRLQCYGPTKGGEVTELPLNAAAFSVLEERSKKKGGPSVFPIEIFKSLRKRFCVLNKRVGLRDIRFHDTRHTFASALAMAGTDLMVIQKLLRHKSYQMTLRYAHLHPSHLEGATEVLCLEPSLAHTSAQQDPKVLKLRK
jgi:integrase